MSLKVFANLLLAASQLVLGIALFVLGLGLAFGTSKITITVTAGLG